MSENEEDDSVANSFFVEIPRFDGIGAVDGFRLLKYLSDFPRDKAFNIFMTCCQEIEDFEEGDLVSGLECFVSCIDEGVYPPKPVLDWIRNAFAAYIKVEGRENIDVLLGLKEKGKRGRGTIFSRRRREKINLYYARNMNTLINVFSIGIRDAAYMVAEDSKRTRGNNAPSDSWLEEQYRKKWKPAKFGGVRHGMKTCEQRKIFLERFPEYTIPDSLKAEYGLKS